MFSPSKSKSGLPRHYTSSPRDNHNHKSISISSIVQNFLKLKLKFKLFSLISFLSSLVVLVWIFKLILIGNKGDRRSGRIITRNWNSEMNVEKVKSDSDTRKGELYSTGSNKVGEEMILILCPMKNSLEHIYHFFSLLDSLSYPRHLLQIAILVSDSTDRTYVRAIELAEERQIKWGKKGMGGRGRYDKIQIFNRDFRDDVVGREGQEMEVMATGGGVDAEGEGEKKIAVEADKEAKKGAIKADPDGLSNIGGSRHDFSLQIQRRKLLAKSRSWLLTSSLGPEIDYVLWLDVDIVEFKVDLIQTLMGWAVKEKVEVVVPNCMWKSYNEMGSYDRNNWAETPESLAFQATLQPSDILIEGYATQLKTHRLNMADFYPLLPSTPPSMLLDGVGGCTALVQADIHRKGAIFPAWGVDHQLETEGFARIVKRLGGKCLGLTGYYVFHGLYG